MGKWNRARANYLKYRGKFNAAAKAHRAAEKKRNAAMAKFRTALKIEVANADSACKNAHKEYEALKREVLQHKHQTIESFRECPCTFFLTPSRNSQNLKCGLFQPTNKHNVYPLIELHDSA